MSPKRLFVQIGHIQPQPRLRYTPTPEDTLYRTRNELAHLNNEIVRLKDRIRRLTEEIELEIADWQTALDTGHRVETIEGLKRRLSRLKGALEYRV